MVKNYAAGLLAALASASSSFGVEHAYCDGPFNFSPFSTTTSTAPNAAAESAAATKPPQPQPATPEPNRARNDYPRTTAAGFDPEALERGRKALEEISRSPDPIKVFTFFFSILLS